MNGLRGFAILAVFIMLGVLGCGDDTTKNPNLPPEAAIQVGDDVISRADVRTFERAECVRLVKFVPVEANAPVPKGGVKACANERRQARLRAISLLIRWRWYEAEAARRNLRISTQKIQKQLASIRKLGMPDGSKFKDYSAETGLTLADVRTAMRGQEALRLLAKLVQTKDVALTEARLASYYKAKRNLYSKPAVRVVYSVLTRDEAAGLRAREALTRGISWETAVRRYSISKGRGPNRGRAKVSQDNPDKGLTGSVFGVPNHTLVGPVQTSYGWFLFSVQKAIPETVPELAEVRDVVETNFTSDIKGARTKRFMDGLEDRYREDTICASGYSIPECGAVAQ